MSGELERIAKQLVKAALLKASKEAPNGGGQATCRVLGSAVAATERTVYRWKAWSEECENGLPPSTKKLVALAKYCGWTEYQLTDLVFKLLEG